MFKGTQTNAYDEIVVKTTDENLTSENWELILNLCDKVQDEGQQGARDVIAAVLRRLAHRNPNVQLYALALSEALSKNCGVELHREIASRAFTQGLEKLITDRTTHEKVKRRALGLIALWTGEFENDPTLGIMEECYTNLKAKNYKFEEQMEPPPPEVDDEVRRKEEEELQRVLEMSVHDKGGRAQWTGYSAASTSGTGASGSSSNLANSTSAGPSTTAASSNQRQGYVPARIPSPIPVQTQSSTSSSYQPTPLTIAPTSASTTLVPATPIASNSTSSIVTRVRALHNFEATEPGELGFEKGDVIKVVDRGYKDWWRGQLRGRTGIFPVNYVEPLPEPTAAEIAREAEQEAVVFSQAASIDKLLNMLRGLDSAKDNLADNEEIQELYRSSMSLRPKIVKLIDKYSQKRADLVSMNESFVKARTIFDQMMEESLARHSAAWDARPNYQQQQPRPDSRGRVDYSRGGPAPQAYGWNPSVYDQPGYNAYPTPAAAYDAPYPAQPYGDPNAYPQQQQQQPPYPQGYPPAHTPYPSQQGPPPSSVSAYSPPQAQQSPPQPQPQPQLTPQLQGQAQQSQLQQQPQQQAQPQQQGPYVFDPNTTYADPNVQAWAQYYAQGGTDLAGAVYFISIPGLMDAPASAAAAGHHEQSAPQSAVTGGVTSPQPDGQITNGGGYQPYGAPQQQQPAGTQGYPSQQDGNAAGYLPSGAAPSSPVSVHPAGNSFLERNPSSQPSISAQSFLQRQGSTSSASYLQHQGSTTSVPQRRQPYIAPSSVDAPLPSPYPQSPGAGPQPAAYGDSLPSPHRDPPAQYQVQYNQMQGQFAAMGVGESGQHEQGLGASA